jgi:hypothetical protein
MGETNEKRRLGMRIREGFEGWLKQDKEDKAFA